MTAIPHPYHDLPPQAATGDPAPDAPAHDPILEAKDNVAADAALLELNRDLLRVNAESNGRIPDDMRNRISEISGQLNETLWFIDSSVNNALELCRVAYEGWALKAPRDAHTSLQVPHFVPVSIAGVTPTEPVPASNRDVLEAGPNEQVEDLIKKLAGGKTPAEFLAGETAALGTIASDRFNDLQNYIDSWDKRLFMLGSDGIVAEGSRVVLRAALHDKIARIIKTAEELTHMGKHAPERAEKTAALQELLGDHGESLIQDKHVQFAVSSLLKEQGLPGSKQELDEYAQKYLDGYQQEVSERRGRDSAIRRALESRLGELAHGSFYGFDTMPEGVYRPDVFAPELKTEADRLAEIGEPAEPVEEQPQLTLAELGARLEDRMRAAGYPDKMIKQLQGGEIPEDLSPTERLLVSALRMAPLTRKGPLDDTAEFRFDEFYNRDPRADAKPDGTGASHRRHSGRGGRRAGQRGNHKPGTVPPQRGPSDRSGANA